jgi:hypothetical protein
MVAGKLFRLFYFRRFVMIIIIGGKVYLILNEGKSYKRKRLIGYIEGDTFHCFRNPDRHLFRQMNAYGFCYELMRDGSFINVIVHLPFGDTLVTTRERILRRGQILNYRSHLLEMQILLRVDHFGDEDETLDSVPRPPQPIPECPSQTLVPPDDHVAPDDEELDLFGGQL